MKKKFLFFLITLWVSLGLSANPDLLFREDWAESPAALPITQAHVANPNLKLNLYGGAVGFLKKSHHENIANDPYYVWSGEIKDTAVWIATLSFQDETAFDLSGEATLTWRTRQSGEHCLRIVLRTLGGDWLISEALVCASNDWQVTTHQLRSLSWMSLEADRIDFSDAVEASDADLSRITEVGFTDMKAGNGSGQSSRVDWIEVSGYERPPNSSFKTISAQLGSFQETASFANDGNLGTRWFAKGEGAWLQAELAGESLVEEIDVAWWKNRERSANFEIQVSLDASSWDTVIEQTSSESIARDYSTYKLPDPVAARFVRIIGNGNSLNDWTGITEWHILGNLALHDWYKAYPEVHDWFDIPWMGDLYARNAPWFFRAGSNWIYVAQLKQEQFYLWDFDLGWLWTSEELFPYLCAIESGDWYLYSSGEQPHLFFNLSTREWKSAS